MNSERTIKVNGLSISYGAKRALANIHLEIEPGHVYGLIGPNGAGKSTLFKAILGLIEYNTGSIKINNKEKRTKADAIAYVPQRDDVDWDFPAVVFDVVMMGRYPHKKLWEKMSKEDKRIAMDALWSLEISELKNRQIGQLSGGQQQRVFIARALCQQANIFLLDEPFVGVDIATENKIVQILKDLANQGKTLVVVHHDLSTVKEYFNRVIILNQRLIAVGDVNEVMTPKNISVAYGGQLDILHQTGFG